MRQPLNVHYNFYRHPRLRPAVFQVSILGPYETSGPGDTPSRRRILVSTPKDASEEEASAPTNPFEPGAAGLSATDRRR